MRKLILYLLMIIMLASLVFAPGTCVDSDGGEDYYEKGTISGAMPDGYISYDKCVSPEGRLREVVCEEGYGTAKLYDCPLGCKEGVCLSESVDDTIHKIIIHENSPSSDVVLMGYIEAKFSQYNFRSMVVSSLDKDILEERITIILYHPNAVIIVGSTSPTDHVTTSVDIGRYLSNKGTHVDYMVSDDIEGDIEISSLFPSECVDSDGKDYYVKGYVIFDGLKHEDYCMPGRDDKLIEAYCKDDFQKLETVYCKYGCEDGACKNYYVKGKVTSMAYWSTADVAFMSYSVNLAGDVTLNVRNNNVGAITITDITLGSDVLNPLNPALPVTLTSGATQTLTDVAGIAAGCSGSYSYAVSIVYTDVETGASYTFTGDGQTLDGACLSEDEDPIVVEPSCEGCMIEESCVPYGTRHDSKYCDIFKEMKSQKMDSESCSNNYECDTNLCVDDQCISSGLIQKILRWFRRIFG